MAWPLTPSAARINRTLLLVSSGVSWWAGDLLFLHYFGDALLGNATAVVLALNMASLIPFVAVTTYPTFRWLGLGAGTFAGAGMIAMSGMAFDAMLLLVAPTTYGPLWAEHCVRLIAWLGAGYVLIILAVVLSPSRFRAWLCHDSYTR